MTRHIKFMHYDTELEIHLDFELPLPASLKFTRPLRCTGPRWSQLSPRQRELLDGLFKIEGVTSVELSSYLVRVTRAPLFKRYPFSFAVASCFKKPFDDDELTIEVGENIGAAIERWVNPYSGIIVTVFITERAEVRTAREARRFMRMVDTCLMLPPGSVVTGVPFRKISNGWLQLRQGDGSIISVRAESSYTF